ncbi:MAG: HNH endonuclease [Gemmatimonadales bacterium]
MRCASRWPAWQVVSSPFSWIFVARRSRNRPALSAPSFRRSPGRSMQSHRDWLLSLHGSVCAYCGTETPSETITLDHVRPRRGQTAYDRPDNLVLACRECNAAKADTPLVAFLMQRRARGVYLLHYGEHLSEPLKELARQASERPILPKEA